MSDYSAKQVNLGPLIRCHSAFYQETCIINACTRSIVVISLDGTKRTIEPVGTSFSNQTVVLHRRETMGSTIAFSGSPVPIPGVSIEVPYFKLQSGPVYVEEFNVVVCTEEDAIVCRHPYAAMKYTESINESLKLLGDKILDAPGLRLLANDPKGRFDEIYTILDHGVITIPVTHMPDDLFVLKIVIINEGSYYTEELDLSELHAGTTNIVEFTDKFIPFVTTSRANAETIASSYMWLNPQTFAEFRDKEQKQYQSNLSMIEAQMNALRAEKDAKIKELTAKLTIINTTLAQIQAERDDYKYKYQYLKGDLNATNDIMSTYRDRQKFDYDLAMSHNDLAISRTKRKHAQEEATFKTWHLIAAAAIPTIAAIGLELFRSKK